MCPANIQGSTNEEKKENGYSAMVLFCVCVCVCVFCFFFFGHAGFLLLCEGFRGL